MSEAEKCESEENATALYKQASRQYATLALKGNAQAAYTLGFMFEHGEGLEENLEKAKKWYELAAAQSHSTALLDLGRLLVEETDEQQIKKGIQYLIQLSRTETDSTDNYEGAYTLSKVYHAGKVPKELDKVVEKELRVWFDPNYESSEASENEAK
ncbi:MAG: sel1 repeat family protein [Parachlamydiaceae bacterium]|nr:MAG: sel1 repeat family protein [Parachlamydiaceae bacterium]